MKRINSICLYLFCQKTILIFISCFLLFSSSVKTLSAQGNWTPLINIAPDSSGGVMLLLTDGTVIVKGYTGGADSIGSVWSKLSPDINGSYVNGTWSTIVPMHDSRLYFASQVLKDGRVFVAGGEYGTGGTQAETYNPQTNTWTMAPPQGGNFGDCNSKLLPDGRVLTAIVGGGSHGTTIYNPTSNTWSASPSTIGSHDEVSWVKLADQSILQVDVNSSNSERYIPSTNQWIVDAQLPNQLYDPFGSEAGASFVLPDGRAFFIGATNQTAIYTPSGTTAPGSWVAGPNIPNNRGAVDAAADMMVNGKILCAFGKTPTSSAHIFDPPTWFYEYDYLANTFTSIIAPNGLDSIPKPCYYTNMLQLPDGNVLFGNQAAVQFYVYHPSGSPLGAGKPDIDSLWGDINCNYTIAGLNFNGISEGAGYGDDWQMATNYPLVRLTSGTNVYYARTFNWNRTGVQTLGLPDTAQFTLPSALPNTSYWLQVVVNGNASDSVFFSPCLHLGIHTPGNTSGNAISIYPNPAANELNISLTKESKAAVRIEIVDLLNRVLIKEEEGIISGEMFKTIDVKGLSKGIYFITTIIDSKVISRKFVKE